MQARPQPSTVEALRSWHSRFHFLSYGLALVLVFIGTKMLIVDLYKIPIVIALGVVALIIGVSIVWSLLRPVPSPEEVPAK